VRRLIMLHDANFSVDSSADTTFESKACAFQYPLAAQSPKSCWQLCKADVQTNMSIVFFTRSIQEAENGNSFQTYWMQTLRSRMAS